MTIFNTYKLFLKYKESTKNTIQPQVPDGPHTDFYSWLVVEQKDLELYINEASKIIDLFDISHYDNLELYDNIKIMNGPIDKARLVEVMQKENFIFIDTLQ
jgi:hypothetical protein